MYPTYGAFWGVGIGAGCGVGWGPGFGPEAVGFVGAGCGVGLSIGFTFVGLGIGFPTNGLACLPYDGNYSPSLTHSKYICYVSIVVR